MAGHSKFKNIQHRKNAQDSRRAKVFTKIAREIMVAASTGQPDPTFNPRLRNALISARRAGLPKDRIEAAIKKGAGEVGSENYEEMRYEGYAPGGIAIIVDALTDNRNRTASDVRSAFTKYGGNLGETGSVNFMFEHVGIILYPASVATSDVMFEAAVEAGASDVISEDDMHEIISAPDDLSTVRDALAAIYGDPEEVRIGWKPKTLVELDVERAQKILKLVDALEDSDDVQYVTGNYSISDEVAEKL